MKFRRSTVTREACYNAFETMNLVSFQFLIPALVLGAWFLAIPGLFWRRLLFAACNVLFIYLCLPTLEGWGILAAFLLSGFLVALVLRRKPNTTILAAYLIVLIASFLVLRKYDIVRLVVPGWIWAHAIPTVGLSYLLFRQIHFLVDVMQQQIEEFSLFSYLNYQLNLFGFLSGPIQRYQEFEDTWLKWDPVLKTRHDVLLAFCRIFVGLIKVCLSVQIFELFQFERAWFLDPLVPSRRALAIGRFMVLFYSYPVYLYFNFSGYCDMVIAAAALIGIRMPENFDRPYVSRNMIEYWTRFHRSLGFWIRDYLFTPLYKAAVQRRSDKAALLVFPCYFVAFVLAGVWHGPSLNFLVFGILHGIGASVPKIWEYFLLKRGGRKGLKQYLTSNPIRFGAVVLTINFVCFTMLFFPHDLQTTWSICNSFAHRLTR